tara:strand:- start:275 stop:487 length:213 start_codon:yes stop_codon:yes gene_type:complete
MGISGLTEDAPLRAAKKWASVYRDDYRRINKLSPDRWEIVFGEVNQDEIESLRAEGTEVMPGKLFFLDLA